MAHGYVLCRKCDVRFHKKEKKCPNCGKKYKKPLYARWWFVLLYLGSFAFFVAANVETYGLLEPVKQVQALIQTDGASLWDELVLGDMLPAPPTRVKDVNSNRADKLEVDLKKMTQMQFSAYVQACKDLGFNEFSNEGDSDYEAYNTEGFKVDISLHYGSHSRISLVAPGERNTQWLVIGLAAMLPAPQAFDINVEINTDKRLEVTLELMTQEDFNIFVEGCKAAGFVEASTETAVQYTAYNTECYNLSVGYNTYWHRASVKLCAPLEMTTLRWPTVGPARQLSAPPHRQGNITCDTAEQFTVYVAGVTPQGYANYVQNCEEKGFTVNHDRGENSYHAYNKAWYELRVSYEYGNIMCINVIAPDPEDIPTPTPTQTPKVTSAPSDTPKAGSSTTAADGMRPEFKKAMDEYEEFFDDYVELMKRLEKNPNDVSLLLQYAQFMAQYDRTMKALEAWEEEDLNSKEMSYYITVTNRISKKLLEVVQ